MGESIWADAHWSGASNRKFISGTVADLGVWGLGTDCSTGRWFFSEPEGWTLVLQQGSEFQAYEWAPLL